MCRNVRDRSAASAVSLTVNSRHHQVRRQRGDQHRDREPAHDPADHEPRSGPPSAGRPRSMPCWTAIGTATRPAVATSASSERAGRARRAAPASSAQPAPQRRQRAVRRPAPVSGQRVVRRQSTARRHPASSGRVVAASASSAAPLGLGPLVGGDQVGVAGHAGQQLGVRAAGDDPAVLEVDHLVGERDGGPPVGHRPGSTRPRRPSRSPARIAASTRGSTRAGRVVEHQQPGPAGQRPGQGEPLPLAAGQRGAALADRVSSPSGSAATNPSAWASRSAAQHRSSSTPARSERRCCRARCRRRRTAPAAPARPCRPAPAAVSSRSVDAVEQRPRRRPGRPAGRPARRSSTCRSRSGRPARPCGRPARRSVTSCSTGAAPSA